MAKSAVINFQILGDSRSGEQALQRTTAAADKVEPSAKVAGAALGDVKDKLLGMVPGGQQASGVLSKVGAASGETGSIMKGALVGGAAAAGVAIAGLVATGVSKYASLTAEVTKFKNVSGASAEESSKLVAVSKGLGVETDVLSTAMFKLGANVQTQPDKFKALGIEIAHNKDGTVNLVGTLENASAAYNKSTDAAEKDAIAKQLGGKAGQALIPILKGGTDAINQFADAAKRRGEVFTDDDLQKGKDMRASFRDLGQAATGLEISLAKNLVPTVTGLAKASAEAVDDVNKLLDVVHKLHGAEPDAKTNKEWDVYFSNLKHGQKAAQQAVDDYRTSQGKAKVSQEELTAATAAGVDVTDQMSSSDIEAATAEKKVADAAHAAGAELEKRWEATNKLLDAQAGAIDSDLAFRKAEQGLADANQTVTDKQTALNDAIKQHGANSAEAKAATEDLAKAQQDAVGAVISDAEAFVKLKDDQAAANGETLTAQQNHDLLRQRLQDVANALGPNSPLRAQLQGYITDLKNVPSRVSTDFDLNLPGPVHIAPGQSGQLGLRARAGGGEVGAGDYLVADAPGDPHGTGELLHLEPGSRGHVTNAAATRRLMQGAAGGARATVNITANHYWNVGVLDRTVVPLIDARINEAMNQLARMLPAG